MGIVYYRGDQKKGTNTGKGQSVIHGLDIHGLDVQVLDVHDFWTSRVLGRPRFWTSRVLDIQGFGHPLFMDFPWLGRPLFWMSRVCTDLGSKFCLLMHDISSKVPKLATKLSHIAMLPWNALCHYQLVSSLYLHQPESHQ